MFYYEVAPTKIIRANAHSFTYESESKLNIGQLVTIPIGNKKATGIIISTTKKPTYATKHITTVLEYPPLPIELIKTILWTSEYYNSHLANTLQTALPAGITKKRRNKQLTNHHPNRVKKDIVLTTDQKKAIDSIIESKPGTVLLHGVTGSGKTAVYINTAKNMITSGKSVILLVPEISLTSQLVAEFNQHFDNIILTHSKQTESERHMSWTRALTSNKPMIVIGPRSALFMPLSKIGVIIIDEAHEPSYKQDKSPKYSSLRVASVLANFHKAKVIQGSATPLVSEYYLAKHMNQPIIKMYNKAVQNVKPPEISLVAMTKRGNFSSHRFISNILNNKITQALQDKKQVIIFHNRRGSANITLCKDCGWSANCPQCFIPLTLHADAHYLKCHICNAQEKIMTHCPLCSSVDIIHKGIGTKLIESELRKIFPNAKIMRFDGDNDESLNQNYQKIYDGDIDIIIGTQIVAKGLDLPNVQVVGIIQADTGITLPDFMASERTFQLISQSIGRIGRTDSNTYAVIQTYRPDDFSIQCAIKQDYITFYKQTIANRKRALFPPFTYLLKLTCIYKTQASAIKNSKIMATKIQQSFSDISIFGPSPSFYERQKDTYRWQIIIKSPTRKKIQEIIKILPAQHWQYDIDPMTLL